MLRMNYWVTRFPRCLREAVQPVPQDAGGRCGGQTPGDILRLGRLLANWRRKVQAVSPPPRSGSRKRHTLLCGNAELACLSEILG